MTDDTRDPALAPGHSFYNPPTTRDDLLLPESAAPSRAGRQLPYQPPPELSPQEKFFVLEYLKDFSATAAGIRAGYSSGHGSILMQKPLVKTAIEAAIAERSLRTGLNAERVLDTYGLMFLGDPRGLFDEKGRLLGPADIPEHLAPLIAGVKTRVQKTRTEDGEIVENEVQEIKLIDKVMIGRDLMKHLGMLTERKEITINDNRVERMREARKRLASGAIEADYTEVTDDEPREPSVEDFL